MATKKDRNEIKWNIINAALAGALVLFGSFSDGVITPTGVVSALSASVVVAITKFKGYWTTNNPKKMACIFNFI